MKLRKVLLMALCGIMAASAFAACETIGGSSNVKPTPQVPSISIPSMGNNNTGNGGSDDAEGDTNTPTVIKTVTEARWGQIFQTLPSMTNTTVQVRGTWFGKNGSASSLNETMKVAGTRKYVYTVYQGGKTNQITETYYANVGGVDYEYTKDGTLNTWQSAETAFSVDYSIADLPNLAAVAEVFLPSYSEFAYDKDSGSYVVSELAWEGEEWTLSVSFANGIVQEITFIQEQEGGSSLAYVYTFSDYGTTQIILPDEEGWKEDNDDNDEGGEDVGGDVVDPEKPDVGGDDGSEDGYDLDGAKKYLKSLYRNSPSETSTDYSVLNIITVGDVDYTITWSVNVSTGVVVEKGETETLINVDEMVKADVEYILTATIADPDGNTTDVLFNRTVKALSSEVYAPITAAPVEGTAYKFQVFQGANQQYLYLNGKMKNTYYFDTATTAEEGLDLLVENTEGGFHLYYMNGEVKTYINVIKSGTHTNGKYHTEEDMANGNDDAPSTPTVYTFSEELGTMVTSLDDKVFYFGCDGSYNTVEPQSQIGSTFYKGYLVTAVSRDEVSDEKKVEEEVNLLNVPSLYYVAAGEIQGLASIGSTYPDVAITWAVEGEGAVLSNNNLTLTAGSSISTVTLTATLKVNEVETTKSFEITLIPNTEAAILEAAFGLEKGEAFANEVELTGVIATVDEAYDAIDHKDITVTMKVQDKYIKCYRLAGNGAEEIKEGYTITVSGIIKNYNGTVQFDQGCYLTSYVSGEAEELQESTIPEALLLPDGAPVKVSGTVSKINTAWNDIYKNISVTISDADGNELYLYRLAAKVEVGDVIVVQGIMTTYSGTRQIGSGSTAEIIGISEEKWNEAFDNTFNATDFTLIAYLDSVDGRQYVSWKVDDGCRKYEYEEVYSYQTSSYDSMQETYSQKSGSYDYIYEVNLITGECKQYETTWSSSDYTCQNDWLLSSARGMYADMEYQGNGRFFYANEEGSIEIILADGYFQSLYYVVTDADGDMGIISYEFSDYGNTTVEMPEISEEPEVPEVPENGWVTNY